MERGRRVPLAIRGPTEDDGNQQRVADLVGLNDKFSSSTRHRNIQTLPDSEIHVLHDQMQTAYPASANSRPGWGKYPATNPPDNLHRFFFRFCLCRLQPCFCHGYVNQNIGPTVVGVVQYGPWPSIDALPMVWRPPGPCPTNQYRKIELASPQLSVGQFYVPGGISPRHGEHAALRGGRWNLLDL